MERLEAQLGALAMMSPAQLCLEWERLHRAAAPNFTPDLLRRGIAHRLQERASPPLPPTVRRELARLMLQHRKGNAETAASRLNAGTRLTRVRHGRSHHVIVDENGFGYDGRHYASLTAIAREITGVAWSGPRFFGVAAKRSERRG